MDSSSVEYIIRFSGDLSLLAKEIGFTYTELLGNFAVINIDETKINALSALNNVLYIEPSRRVYYENINEAYIVNCMNVNPDFVGSTYDDYLSTSNSLTGKGIVVAVIDSGIDLTHPIFRSTDIIEVWDQTMEGSPPEGYNFGTIINEISNIDNTGHGTSVAGIIATCVPDSVLLVVKLRGDTAVSSSTASLIQAIDYCIRKSIELNLPMVINLSYGNNYGNHAGDAILEDYIDQNSELSKITIAVGMGNDADTSRHAQLMFGNIAWDKLEIQVNPFLIGFSIQIWKGAEDIIDIFLRTPEGNEIGPFNERMTEYNSVVNYNKIRVNLNPPTPYNPLQETFFSILPARQYVSEGIWTLMFRPRIIKNGRVDLWLPVEAATSAKVHFINPSPYTTMTIPSTASKVISVGAYNYRTLTYANFSGRGFSRDGDIKPDIAAPGVDISVPVPGGIYHNKSGTSFATPFVSAAAAMLMQWGITDGNDPFMYGQKLKGALNNGAKTLPGYVKYPNEYVGYGALCVNDSIAKLV